MPSSSLSKAANEFDSLCDKVIKKHPGFVCIEVHELDQALSAARSERDVKHAAEVFGKAILSVSRLVDHRRETFKKTWRGKLQAFLSGLYPVVQLGLALTGFAADVLPTYSQLLIVLGRLLRTCRDCCQRGDSHPAGPYFYKFSNRLDSARLRSK